MRAAAILGPTLLLLMALLASRANASDEIYVTAAPCQRSFPLRRYPVDGRAIYLDMRSCKLTEFKPEYIKGLTNVIGITLFENDLEYIDPAIFRSVPTLTRLFISHNKLRELTAFPINSCPNLTHLGLDNNKLTEITDAKTFAACAELYQITLSDNNIKYIHPDVFKSLPNLSWLSLGNNQFTFVPDHMFAERSSRKDLNLLVSGNKLTYLPENFATGVKQGGAGFTNFLFNDNPWQCACLLELLAEVKRAGVEDYESDMEYHGTQPQCVYRGPFPCTRVPSGLLPPHPPIQNRIGNR